MLLGLFGDKRLLLFPGIGDGDFGEPTELSDQIHWIQAIADFDGDGRPDLLLPRQRGGVELLLNRTGSE